MARSRISFSLEAWSSRSHLAFLGIYAHFIDEDYKLCPCLLALKHLIGRHTGDRLGYVLFKVLITYDLTDKIGWFVADNATLNDTTLRKLSHLTPLDLLQQRLRCLGHVLHLAHQAMLHRTQVESFDHIDIDNIDVDAVDEEAAISIKSLALLSEEEQQIKRRSKGFFGKAHNIVVRANCSPGESDISRLSSTKPTSPLLSSTRSLLTAVFDGISLRQLQTTSPP